MPSTLSCSSRITCRTSLREAPTSRSSSTTPALASVPALASAASAGQASGTTSSARDSSNSSSSSPRTTPTVTAHHRPPNRLSPHSPTLSFRRPWLLQRMVPSVPSARRISRLGRWPSRCPASTSTTATASCPGWSFTTLAPSVALSCPLMILITRGGRLLIPRRRRLLVLLLLLQLHLGALLLLRKGRKRMPGWLRGGSMCHCHGRSVDWEGKHHSRMGIMGAAEAILRAAARKMEVHPAARIEHKSAWRFTSWCSVQKSAVFMCCRDYTHRHERTKGIYSLFSMEQSVVFSVSLGHVHIAQKLPTQQNLRVESRLYVQIC